MQINLTWDLFIIVVFLIVLSYSFIIGKTNTVKLVLSSYIAILGADALGNMLNKLFLQAQPLVDVVSFANNEPALILVKIAAFVICMVVLAVRGSFDIVMPEEDPAMDFLITFFFGALSAGLIISSILVFSSGSSFISGGVPINESNIAEMYDASYLVKIMTSNYDIWFALPIFAFLMMSIFRTSSEHEE